MIQAAARGYTTAWKRGCTISCLFERPNFERPNDEGHAQRDADHGGGHGMNLSTGLALPGVCFRTLRFRTPAASRYS